MKNVKKNAILFKLFWYKVFVHWKLKLLNLLMDSVLIIVRLTWFNRLIIEWTRKHNSLSVVDLPGMLKKNFCSTLNFPLGFLGFLSIKKKQNYSKSNRKGSRGLLFHHHHHHHHHQNHHHHHSNKMITSVNISRLCSHYSFIEGNATSKIKNAY